MKIIKVLSAIILAVAGNALFFSGIYTIFVKSPINQELIDSFVDKIFYLFITFGGGSVFCLGSLYLFLSKGGNFLYIKNNQLLLIYLFIFSSYIFVFGLLYHMVFFSPW